WIDTTNGSFAISSQKYAPDVLYPNGVTYLTSFDPEPWPTWIYKLPDGTMVQQEICVPLGSPAVSISWKLLTNFPAVLRVRPFFSGRDYHSLHHENSSYRFDTQQNDGRIRFQSYHGLPTVIAVSNGSYEQKPDWYRNFLYEEEKKRGLD